MTRFSSREDGRPATLWFWDDWFGSVKDVRLCGLAARGLWVDMLGIMNQSEIKGVLIANGRQIDSKDLAKIAGADEAQIVACLIELEEKGVFTRLPDGSIINRRMYKESEISHARAEAGKKGADSRWQTDGKDMPKDDSKPMATLVLDRNGIVLGSKNLNELFEKWWKRYPRKEDKGKALQKWTHLVKALRVDPQRLEDALTGYINYLNGKGTELEYVKYASTFLFAGDAKKGIPGTWEQYLGAPAKGGDVPTSDDFRRSYEKRKAREKETDE